MSAGCMPMPLAISSVTAATERSAKSTELGPDRMKFGSPRSVNCAASALVSQYSLPLFSAASLAALETALM